MVTEVTLETARAQLALYPGIEEIDLLACDLNGILRGKRIPAASLDKAFSEGMKFPRSVLCLDIWGHDVLANGLVWECGDGDGVCLPCGPGLMPMTWSDRPRLQMLTMMRNIDGTPFRADPRQVLAGVVERFRAIGLTPMVATELEFYLMAGDSAGDGRPRPPKAPKSGYDLDGPRVYSMEELDEFDAVLTGIRDACQAQGLPSDTIIVENGPGQFEVNLHHVADPLLAADHAILLRRAVRAVARRHGLHGTFMAKPYGAWAGSGFHLHCSLIDKAGRNIFDDDTPKGSPALRHAIAGTIALMPESMLIFAPHLNSYRRFQPGAHAPTTATWGYENRTTSLRIPASSNKARRFEHRPAGADANPYLVVAAILAGALHGLENHLEPPAALSGDAYGEDTAPAPLPLTWDAAIGAFQSGTILRQYLGETFMRAFGTCKVQELAELGRRVTDVEYATYLGSI
ncbi:glutamine synthetase family protein [Telmatospirillum sp.]|uniref:glutamine synthetase family protein n=1 Tax=Telmatospirillum sp. TaxID=2079197 RepID=UPI002841D358|nr:glutamine synthetase family protein [Telmatospirillum sp.]MDR3441268.1 glutamine synthetase family protein [Telmatospirillum sp.]